MQRLEQVCAKLRQWPRRIVPDQRALAAESLERCGDLFESTQALLLIDDGEPWLSIASRAKGRFRWREDEELRLEDAVAPELTNDSFLAGARDEVRLVAGRARRIKNAIDARVRKNLGRGLVLSVPIAAELVQGRLFVVAPKLDVDVALAVAEPLSTILAVHFEASSQLRTTVREAVNQERVRVARDLHDGLLQSFTGVVLQLETVHSLLDNDPQNARRMITETQGLIMSDQRELRRFVEQLRPRPVSGETKFDFEGRLEELRSRFASQWGVRIAYDVAGIDPHVSGFIGQETFRLIHEAVTNSAKHGRASVVRVGVGTNGSEMRIEVTDNGTGFPFHGRLTLEEMRESRTGPMVLAERVSSLNGTLIVDSTESGAVVTMTVPLGFGA